MTEHSNQPSEKTTREPGSNRVAATVCIWGLAAGLAGLVWLTTLDPFIGLPMTHPINLTLLGFCFAIGIGFTVVIWWPRYSE